MKRVLVSIGVALTFVSCAAPPSFVIENRSDATIAFMPGMVVRPCSQGRYSADQVRVAGEEQEAAVRNGGNWVPDGAVRFDVGLPGSPAGAPKPQTLIISGTALPRVVDGPVEGAALPLCGGAPLGID